MNNIFLRRSCVWSRQAWVISLVLLVSCVAVLAGQATLVWISLDGVRHDYIDRAETPVLDRLVREGAVTRALVPTFPTLTFPSHVSQATGARPVVHGILSNSFYDRVARRTYSFPPFASLLQAEPIWNTAQRQGVRTAVRDWPLSHRQQGAHRTDYHNAWYDGRLSDEDRLEDLLAIYREDDHDIPLRFLLGYGDALDKTGHRHGPDAPEIALEMEALDHRLGLFVESLLEEFRRRAGPEDRLYIFLTTDHGMSPVHTAVHVERLTGLVGRDDVTILTAGNLAQVYVHEEVRPRTRRRILDSVRTQVAEHAFVRLYTQETLPEAWGFRHPERGGDLVLVMEPGYVFDRRTQGITAPAEETRSVRGAHGYDPDSDPNQLGVAVFWRYPVPLGGHALGRVDALQLHATAAKVLGIEPARTAFPTEIDIWSEP